MSMPAPLRAVALLCLPLVVACGGGNGSEADGADDTLPASEATSGPASDGDGLNDDSRGGGDSGSTAGGISDSTGGGTADDEGESAGTSRGPSGGSSSGSDEGAVDDETGNTVLPFPCDDPALPVSVVGGGSYATVQDGVDSAPPGGTVQICPGPTRRR